MFTRVDFVNKTRELVAASPDNIYWGRYSYDGGENDNGSVGCLFGQVLRALGVDDDISIDSASITSTGGVRGIESVLNDSEEIRQHMADSHSEAWKTIGKWASQIQGSQDSHEPWDAALAAGDRYHDLAAALI
jgi:hypothetical protein